MPYLVARVLELLRKRNRAEQSPCQPDVTDEGAERDGVLLVRLGRDFPLADHGLEWIQPPIPLAHSLDDGTATVVCRSIDETSAGWVRTELLTRASSRRSPIVGRSLPPRFCSQFFTFRAARCRWRVSDGRHGGRPRLLLADYFGHRVLKRCLPGWPRIRCCRSMRRARPHTVGWRLLFIKLGLYLAATAATAFSWNFWSFCLSRSLTGGGIGGEYAAINSAVDELIPARIRGHVDLLINSTFWVGAFLGSLGLVLLLHMKSVPPTFSWRFVFGIGAVLGLGVLFMRRCVPESPRGLLIHAHKGEAQRVVSEIEQQVAHCRELGPAEGTIRLHVQDHTPWDEIWDAMLRRYRERSLLGFSLMVAQAFFYNAISFTYGLVLLRYCGVPADSIGYWLLPLAAGNFLGPLLIGRLRREPAGSISCRDRCSPRWVSANF